MKSQTQTAAPERGTAPNLEIYQEFIGRMADRADNEIMELAEKIAGEHNSEAILAMQKKLKSTHRKEKILSRLLANTCPEDLLELIDAIAEPGVKQEFQPMFDTIQDLIVTLRITRWDIMAMPNPLGVRHE